jgi:hypothetical protein
MGVDDPKPNSSTYELWLETIEVRFENMHTMHKEPKSQSFFFFALSSSSSSGWIKQSINQSINNNGEK